MLAKIKRGIGSPGKLWTGHTPETGAVGECWVVERSCPCGATTRKFRFRSLDVSPEALEALELPTVFVTMGGVGSVAAHVPESDTTNKRELQCWNWSGRVGGHVIVNPLLVLSGYYDYGVPAAKPGFGWVATYGGETLSEHVLVRVGENTGHRPELVLPGGRGQCPKCREKEALENLPEHLTVLRGEIEGMAGVEYSLPYYERELGLRVGATEFPARGLLRLAWRHRNDELKAVIAAAKERGRKQGISLEVEAVPEGLKLARTRLIEVGLEGSIQWLERELDLSEGTDEFPARGVLGLMLGQDESALEIVRALIKVEVCDVTRPRPVGDPI